VADQEVLKIAAGGASFVLRPTTFRSARGTSKISSRQGAQAAILPCDKNLARRNFVTSGRTAPSTRPPARRAKRRARHHPGGLLCSMIWVYVDDGGPLPLRAVPPSAAPASPAG